MTKNLNDQTEKVGDDLKSNITGNSKLTIAASIFSIYGYESLKSELNKIGKLRFIFTDPNFIESDKNSRENKRSQINTNLSGIKSISGSIFEINLKNELKGRAVARECKRWIEKKVEFKSIKQDNHIQPHINLENEKDNFVYIGINEFTSAGLGYEKDNSILNPIIKLDDFGSTQLYLQSFNKIWNDKNLLQNVTHEVTDYIADLYKENSPEFIYYFTLSNIFDEFLEDISEDELANEKTGFKKSVIWNKLYDFQRDAVLGLINKLERHNGCILANSVRLGKTFMAFAVIKYFQERIRTTLVLCQKKLGDYWQTFLNNYKDNSLIKHRLNYDVLYEIAKILG